jgi:hypothetical protein
VDNYVLIKIYLKIHYSLKLVLIPDRSR